MGVPAGLACREMGRARPAARSRPWDEAAVRSTAACRYPLVCASRAGPIRRPGSTTVRIPYAWRLNLPSGYLPTNASRYC